MPPRLLRIHGDNIVECDRALRLIMDALDPSEEQWIESPLYVPRFKIRTPGLKDLEVQLFSGFGRWAFDLDRTLRERGAPFVEAADAVITAAGDQDDEFVEQPLLAIEFCGSLPAGNNAWQRCGRALTYAKAGVPYLYISELGGYELTSDRVRKSARMPNPLVPFGYAALHQISDQFALPIYLPSPSIDSSNAAAYDELFGTSELEGLVRSVLLEESPQKYIDRAVDKALGITAQIASERSRGSSVLQGEDWVQLHAHTQSDRLGFLLARGLPWSKRITIQTTATLHGVQAALSELAPAAAGAADMPFGVLGRDKRRRFASALADLYGDALSQPFLRWVGRDQSHLAIAFVAGFKPAGEDSRPDRGMVPLARMVLGDEIDLLSVVYGPGRPEMWSRFDQDPAGEARRNGLWRAVISLSDAVLADSLTRAAPIGILTERARSSRDPVSNLPIPAASETPTFSEHDVDTVLRMLLSGQPGLVFEGLCNPPGGDWSGISILDVATGSEFRWTSLPRVTAANGKRPDHVFQFHGPSGPIALSIESKDRARDFDRDIGPRLRNYVADLFKLPPNIMRAGKRATWQEQRSSSGAWSGEVYSAGAFIFTGEDLSAVADEESFDMVFAVDLARPPEVTVRLAYRPALEEAALTIRRLAERFNGWVVVEEDAL